MNPWSNIDVSFQDGEITEINKLESTFEHIPDSVLKIRELITRFEVCHFKFEQHLKYINSSILTLDPVISPDKIGSNHIKQGENAWKNDKTGRSLIGQQYLWIIRNWLDKTNQDTISKLYDKNLDVRISEWLGERTFDKERIIKLLIARLTYDWEPYKKLQKGGEFIDLEYQTCRMDICHYAFPEHLDSLLQAIGEMKPSKDMEGCGSFNSQIKAIVKKEFSELCFTIQKMTASDNFKTRNKNDQLKVWLYACLAKTIKEQIGLEDSLPKLSG